MEKIKITSIIEIAGKPEEHVKETMKKMLNIIRENKKIKLLKEDIAPTKSVEFPSSEGRNKKVEVFSSFLDLEIEFPNFDELMQFLFMFMPSSIEIIKPEEVNIGQKKLEDSLNDLLGKLHEQSKITLAYQALLREFESLKEKTNASGN